MGKAAKKEEKVKVNKMGKEKREKKEKNEKKGQEEAKGKDQKTMMKRLYRDGKPDKKDMCKYYMDKGYCNNGANCTWAHGEAEFAAREDIKDQYRSYRRGNWY